GRAPIRSRQPPRRPPSSAGSTKARGEWYHPPRYDSRSIVMKRWPKRPPGVLVLALGVAWCALALITRARARELMTNPAATRKMSTETPADYQLAFDDVRVKTSDGLNLVGWYLPSKNGAALIVQHGYKDSRDLMLTV